MIDEFEKIQCVGRNDAKYYKEWKGGVGRGAGGMKDSILNLYWIDIESIIQTSVIEKCRMKFVLKKKQSVIDWENINCNFYQDLLNLKLKHKAHYTLDNSAL